MVITTETYNWTMCREEETAESLALNGTSILSRVLWSGEDREIMSKRLWITSRKQYFSDTTRQMHIGTYSSCDHMHKNCMSSSQAKAQPG